jgi:hypothetical protein
VYYNLRDVTPVQEAPLVAYLKSPASNAALTSALTSNGVHPSIHLFKVATGQSLLSCALCSCPSIYPSVSFAAPSVSATGLLTSGGSPVFRVFGVWVYISALYALPALPGKLICMPCLPAQRIGHGFSVKVD